MKPEKLFALLLIFEFALIPISANSQAIQELNLSIENTPDGSIQVSWQEPENAAVYYIYKSSTPYPATAEEWALVKTIARGTESTVLTTEADRAFYGISYDPIPQNFVYLSGGTFHNGTSNVTISPFCIGKYEVTQADYQAVTGVNPSQFSGNPNHPVDKIHWYRAIMYCNLRSIQESLTPCYSYGSNGTNMDNWPFGWQSSNSSHTEISCDWSANGYRLPTEMEWMFAAKGGNQSLGFSYSGSNDIDEVAWYSQNSSGATHAVGTKVPNELGTYDMAGNIHEWCWDIQASYPSGEFTDPTGAANGTKRVTRGGSWGSNASSATNSSRSSEYPAYCNARLGFRVVKAIPWTPIAAGAMFDPPAGIYSEAISLVISSATEDSNICYTTDGSTPSESSMLYTGPFIIDETSTIRAKVFKEGWNPANTESAAFTIGTVSNEMIFIQGGTFNVVGDDGEPTNYNVSLSSYYLSRLEISQTEYQSVMNTNPSFFIGNPDGPVETVTWFNTIEYCNRRSIQESLTPCYTYRTYGTNPDDWPSDWSQWANHIGIVFNRTVNGYRLPTEMEWMYAAKGGQESPASAYYPWSGTIHGHELVNYAWHSENNTPNGAKQVGTRRANQIGIYDMGGNVSEWCWNIMGTYPYATQTNPTGPLSGSYRVFRGGGYDAGIYDCTVYKRYYGDAPVADSRIGFRICRTAP